MEGGTRTIEMRWGELLECGMYHKVNPGATVGLSLQCYNFFAVFSMVSMSAAPHHALLETGPAGCSRHGDLLVCWTGMHTCLVTVI